MNDPRDKNSLKIILDDASDLSLNQIRQLINKMTAPEIAHALESSPPKQRTLLFSLLKTEEEGDVLFELGEEIQQDLVSNISNEELTEAVKELELDEIVDILQNLPEERMSKILENMSMVDRKRIQIGLNYSDNTAGGLLNTDVISVRPNNSINEVINYLIETLLQYEHRVYLKTSKYCDFVVESNCFDVQMLLSYFRVI